MLLLDRKKVYIQGCYYSTKILCGPSKNIAKKTKFRTISKHKRKVISLLWKENNCSADPYHLKYFNIPGYWNFFMFYKQNLLPFKILSDLCSRTIEVNKLYSPEFYFFLKNWISFTLSSSTKIYFKWRVCLVVNAIMEISLISGK